MKKRTVSRLAKVLIAICGISLANVPKVDALQPSNVPANLPAAQRTSFLKTKAALETERDDLLRQVETHNTSCPKDMPEDSPSLLGCKREQQRLNKAQAAYLTKVTAFNQAVASAASRQPGTSKTVDPTVARLEKQIASDEEAIRRLGLNKRAADFEEWSKLTQQARDEFISETLRILARLALDEATIGLKSQTSNLSSALTRDKAEELIVKLERLGADNPNLADAIRALARSTTIKERTDAANTLISATGAVLKTGTSSPDKLKATVEGFFEATAGIGAKKLGLVGWQTRALVSTAELTAELGFAFAEQKIAESAIRDLDHMTEQQLKAVQKLSEVMRKHVAELKAAKQRAGVTK